MSKNLRYTCNRCSLEQSEADAAMGPVWLNLRLSAQGYEVPDLYICPGCLPALADFLKAVPRELIGAFVLHDREVDFSVKGGVRIGADSVATVSEEMTTTFRPERIEIENASQWLIEEFSIAEFAQVFGDARRPRKIDDGVPGEDFMKLMPTTLMRTAGPGDAISIRVRYVGGNPEGGVWKAKLYGKAAGFPEEGSLA